MVEAFYAVPVRMKPIDTFFTYKGFDFRQIAREGDVAVYSQCFKGGKMPVAYEVVVIQKHDGYTIMGKTYPPAEFYPSTNDWGTKGFTIVTDDTTKMKQKALDKMKAVLHSEGLKAQKRADKAEKTKAKA
jgi:hypothetical protein